MRIFTLRIFENPKRIYFQVSLIPETWLLISNLETKQAHFYIQQFFFSDMVHIFPADVDPCHSYHESEDSFRDY